MGDLGKVELSMPFMAIDERNPMLGPGVEFVDQLRGCRPPAGYLQAIFPKGSS